jgi:hypothetical protein
MRPELVALAASQAGLVTRRQAILTGYSERELRTHTAVGGPWVTVRRGVYVERRLWEALEPVGQWRLRDRAAHLTMGVPHVLSHDSAARAHGIPFLQPPLDLVHATRPGVWGSRTEHGVKHHLARIQPGQVVVDGLRITGMARTVLDLGREHGFVPGLVAADHALRHGLVRADLEQELEVMRCWPHIGRARAAVEHSDGGAENPGETLARNLVTELGLGRPETQFPVRTEAGVYWCDLIVGCHVFEFDGRIKYRRAADGGVAHKSVEDVLWDEKKRQRLVCAEGLGMSRIIWEDFWGPARARARKRLLAEYAVTEARFGSRLPEHLARFAVTVQRPPAA